MVMATVTVTVTIIVMVTIMVITIISVLNSLPSLNHYPLHCIMLCNQQILFRPTLGQKLALTRRDLKRVRLMCELRRAKGNLKP